MEVKNKEHQTISVSSPVSGSYCGDSLDRNTSLCVINGVVELPRIYDSDLCHMYTFSGSYVSLIACSRCPHRHLKSPCLLMDLLLKLASDSVLGKK